MEGKQIGNFRIIQKLGEGGMGVVYKGIDVQLDRPVAIKMLNVELGRNPELVQRFQAEARAQANLNHPNIATLYAFLVTDDGACMVMEFVEGDSFEQILRRGGPMNPRDVVPLFKQALLGIGAAHRMGIVHRDIKPANLMVNRQGVVKVMDFGIAKAMGTRGMTRTGMQMGTILYMSPEQIQSRTIDVRTDIYALGVTLYEMLCGHVPFESESDFQVMHDHVNTPPPPLTRYYPYVAREFENVVAKALEKNPDNRFQTVEEFGSALEHPESVPPPVFSYAPPPAMRGTTVEQRPVSGAGYGAGPAVAPGFTTVQGVPPPGTPPYGTAPGTPPYGTAPGMQPGFTPPPYGTYGTAPGAQPGFTPPYGTAPGVQPGFTPPPVGGAPGTVAPAQSATRAPISGRNKVILGAAAVAVVVLLAIVLWPKGTTTGGGGTAGGGGGGGTGTQLAGNTTGPAPVQGDGSTINVVKGDAATPGPTSNTSSTGGAGAAGAAGTAGTAKDVHPPKQKTSAPTPVKQQPTPQPPQQPQQPQPQPTPQAQQPQPQPTPPPQPQPTPPPQPTPQPQPTPAQRQAQNFPVKHRHVVMNGFQSYTFFCGGWLSIRPDGSVTYVCTGTNDPSGRCDKVMFPAGSIKQARMKAAGELHIQTSGMGNWDFFDLNVAGATASAYQAILSMGR